MATDVLDDRTVRTAKAGAAPKKLFDGGGMFWLVMPEGGKRWRLKYRYAGKEKLLALGVYPEVSLKAARDKRDAARKLLAAGGDPGAAKQADKLAKSYGAANTFEAVAREWFESHQVGWAAGHASKCH